MMRGVDEERTVRPRDVRPNVMVSRCLGFAAVRYDGEMLESGFVTALRDHVNFLPVCPEVGIGLGVPRDPVRLVRGTDETRLVQPSTGRDLTEPMRDFADRTLEEGGRHRLDGVILKSRSPSCGLGDAKIYREPSDPTPSGRESGLFAAAIRNTLPWAAVNDERSLADPILRQGFLVHLWMMATLRVIAGHGEADALLRFHGSHESLFEALDPGRSGELAGRLEKIVRDVGEAAIEHPVKEPSGLDDIERYRRVVGEALAADGAGRAVSLLQSEIPAPLRRSRRST